MIRTCFVVAGLRPILAIALAGVGCSGEDGSNCGS